MRCTMPGCKAEINGWTGLRELANLRRHFSRKHKIELSMDAALRFRLAIEAGHAPVRIDVAKERFHE